MSFYFVQFFDDSSAVVNGRPKDSDCSFVSRPYDSVTELIEGEQISPEPCKECGQMYSNKHNTEPLCFHCDFWVGYINHPDAIRVNHSHYIDGGNSNNKRGFLGHGGRVFIIEKDDGAVITTNNLWAQGPIPEHFWDRLPDNARFVKKPASIGHRQGYLGVI